MDGPHTRQLADTLNDHLTGMPIQKIAVPEGRWQANMLLMNCVGQVVQRVHSYGKWHFFDFSHGISWVFQLLLRSNWQLPTPPLSTARPSETPPLLTVHFSKTHASLRGNPVFYIMPTEDVRNHAEIRTLGPDPLANPTAQPLDAFTENAATRLRQSPGRTVAAALLDQDIVAGLGNELKCETLFRARLSPATRVGTLLSSDLHSLANAVYEVTNDTFAALHTHNAPARHVYDRSGLPCTTCGTLIDADRSGHDGHLSWHCPNCQSPRATLFEQTGN